MVAVSEILTAAECNGLKLFLNKGCVKCLLGPQFTDMQFHNNALPGTDPANDSGRITATYSLKDDPFNCLGEFSDAKLQFHC
jgi:cytochrome c peroxidase